MTTISELQARTGKVELTATVLSVEAPRTFDKFGKQGRVANAKLQDATGQVTLTLWNEQCEQVTQGDTVIIHNGWVSEYRGELQLGTGKFGSLEVKKGDGSGAAAVVAAHPAPTLETTTKVKPIQAPTLASTPVNEEDLDDSPLEDEPVEDSSDE